MAESLLYKPNTMHFHVTQLEMIEGDKTTTATLFFKNIFLSPKHFVICLTSEFAFLQQPFIIGNKKRSYEDGHLHCHAAFLLFYWVATVAKLQGLTTTWRWDRIQRSQDESSWFRFWSFSTLNRWNDYNKHGNYMELNREKEHFKSRKFIQVFQNFQQMHWFWLYVHSCT